jgi:hypothetical protein
MQAFCDCKLRGARRANASYAELGERMQAELGERLQAFCDCKLRGARRANASGARRKACMRSPYGVSVRRQFASFASIGAAMLALHALMLAKLAKTKAALRLVSRLRLSRGLLLTPYGERMQAFCACKLRGVRRANSSFLRMLAIRRGTASLRHTASACKLRGARRANASFLRMLAIRRANASGARRLQAFCAC